MDANKKIGIPAGLLYYMYQDLWLNFFHDIGCDVVVSGNTTYDIAEKGIDKCNDEACLSFKVFMGHVDSLLDRVDYILIPRILSVKKGELLCTNFSALYDIVNNTYRGIKILNYNMDEEHGLTEEKAFLHMARELGVDNRIAKKAYEKARRIQDRTNRYTYLKQMRKLKNNNRCKILMVGHPYNTDDPLIGGTIASLLEQLNVEVIYAYRLEGKEKLKQQISSNIYWTYNIDLLKGIEYYQDKVDGILLLTAFPCGPDSLSNEMIIRKVNKPILSIIMDELKSISGIETRLESFIDILEERRSTNECD